MKSLLRLFLPESAARTQSTRRVRIGTEADDSDTNPTVSADGRFVAVCAGLPREAFQ
jgi:hypothetical protein